MDFTVILIWIVVTHMKNFPTICMHLSYVAPSIFLLEPETVFGFVLRKGKEGEVLSKI